MKKLSYYSIVILGLILCTITSCYSIDKTATVFNIRNYGAKGDGVTDDSKAIQLCINAAIKRHDSNIVIPYGTYSISKQIDVNYTEGYIEIDGIKNKNGKVPVLKCIKPTSALSVSGYFTPISTGVFALKNLSISGGFSSKQVTNILINNNDWFFGIRITDKKQAILENVSIADFYGEGIFISTTQPENNVNSSRFSNVNISNCKVINCWGYNPKTDSYGDGIYLAAIASATVNNNIIKNDFLKTGYLGRCGLVIEYNAENFKVTGNTISGYDRGIHIEADYGNHLIKNNIISGTDLGIIVVSKDINAHNNPIQILNNQIYNKGLSKGYKLNRTYAITSIADRAMINFNAERDSRKGSLVSGNTINISGDYDYFSNAVMNIKANGITVSGNNIIVTKPESLKYPLVLYNYSNSSLINNKLINVKSVKVKPGTDIISISKKNILNGTKVDFTN